MYVLYDNYDNLSALDGTRKGKGFGYVTFVFEEDAQKAKDNVKTLRGRSLTIAFSEKKPRTNRPEKKSQESKADDDDNQDHDGDTKDGDDVNNNQEIIGTK